MGSGVTGFQHGDPVAVLPVWHSCGRCHACRSGQENFCFYVTHLMGAGVGFDGGLAPYVLVPETRYLVPIGDLDPVAAAPLTDAGLTTYTAIKPVLPMLYPGSTAVVIGVGGLGLLGVELLRQLCATRVIAVDTSEARLQLATENGADHALLSDACAPAQIREITQGIGAQLVLDCVGAEATIAMGAAALARQGRLTVVGAAGGEFPFEFHKVPWGSQIATSLNGGTANLKELLDMAALGRFKSIVDRYPLSQVKQAYDDMQHGRLKGRAVAIPE